jgi:hypothetical protein
MMKCWLGLLLLLPFTTGAAPIASYSPAACGCTPPPGAKSCGVDPAFMSKNEGEIARELGFDVPGDHELLEKTAHGQALFQVFAGFLDKSKTARTLYPNTYSKNAEEASVLTLESKFVPKNITEMDEYFRCTIPQDKYCLYQHQLRPYIGLVAKTSGIDFSFLACQSYVESRFNRDARSNAGAVGYSQIQPSNINFLNEVLKKSIRNSSNRKIASTPSARQLRVNKVQQDIANIWWSYWKGNPKVPNQLRECDLTCYRQAFLAQALWLKSDTLALATSSSGLKTDFDEAGNLIIENMDAGDSLLILAGSYNVGVTKMIRLLTPENRARNISRDVNAFSNYVMRIRNCTQRFSAEQIDFNDDQDWTASLRTEKKNQQRGHVVTCMLHPCPYREPAAANHH